MNRLFTVSAYLGIAVVLTCLVWASRLALRPVMPPRPAPKKVVIEVPQPQPKPEPSAGSVKLARVGLRRAGPPSAEALKAVDAGKFIVRTSFSDPAQKPEIYHQLCLRGGIYTVEGAYDPAGTLAAVKTIPARHVAMTGNRPAVVAIEIRPVSPGKGCL